MSEKDPFAPRPVAERPFGFFVASGFSWALGAGGGDWLAESDLALRGSEFAGEVWNAVGALVAPGWPGDGSSPESGLPAAELAGFVSRALLEISEDSSRPFESVERDGGFWGGEIAFLWSVAAFLSGAAPLPVWLAAPARVCGAPECARWLPLVPSSPGSLVAVPACPACCVALSWVGGSLVCPSR